MLLLTVGIQLKVTSYSRTRNVALLPLTKFGKKEKNTCKRFVFVTLLSGETLPGETF